MNDLKYLNAETLYNDIIKLVNKDVTLFDALVEYSEKNKIEIEVIGAILKKNSSVKSIIIENAHNLKLLKIWKHHMSAMFVLMH